MLVKVLKVEGAVRVVKQLTNGDMASGSNDYQLRIWNSSSFALKNRFPFKTNVVSITSLIGNSLAAGDGSAKIQILNAEYQIIKSFNLNQFAVRSLIELQNGFLAAGSCTGYINIYEESTWTLYKSFVGHYLNQLIQASCIETLAVLSNGYLISGGDDTNLRVWNLDFNLVTTLTGHTESVRSVIQLNSGLIASSSDDNNIIIWNQTTWTIVTTLTGHTKPVYSIIQLANGYIASGSFDNTIKIWDSKAFKLYMTIATNQTGGIYTVCQLSSGLVLSGADDRTINAWQLNF